MANDNDNDFQPLKDIKSTVVCTAAAAFYLNRRPATLRAWSSQENGPIRPLRVNGRLAWRVADILAVLEGHK